MSGHIAVALRVRTLSATRVARLRGEGELLGIVGLIINGVDYTSSRKNADRAPNP
jgi:hypothetical protein